MATTNLGLALPTSDDGVDVSDLTGNFTIIDNLGKDYVTGRGNDGNWTWRKWKSGRMECWYVGSNDFVHTNQFGESNLYYSNVKSYTYPNGGFSAAPSTIVSGSASGNFIALKEDTTPTARTGSGLAISAVAYESGTTSVGVSIYACGTAAS